MAIRSYQDLEVWQKAMRLVGQVYRLTRKFPKEELYALTSQVRRAGVSVPANIAEGWARGSRKEYVQFLRVARGSLLELETLLMIAENLGYLRNTDPTKVLSQVQEISRMLSGLMASLKHPK